MALWRICVPIFYQVVRAKKSKSIFDHDDYYNYDDDDDDDGYDNGCSEHGQWRVCLTQVSLGPACGLKPEWFLIKYNR